MIIVKLTGGLGNQLFQYSFGRSLFVKYNKSKLLLDTNFFKTYDWHGYSLSNFNIVENIASNKDIDELITKKNILWTLFDIKVNFLSTTIFKFYKKRPLDQLSFLLKKKLGIFKNIYSEPHFNFDEKSNLIGESVFLDGYWQSEKYFSGIRSLLLKEITPKSPPSVENGKILSIIDEVNSVSLHIRRGNYVSISQVQKLHGTCSIEYYEEAVKYIASKVESPHFFVFSDDIEWAKGNVKFNYPMAYVDINDSSSDFEDLRLMYNCKHNIIANSTFSWWGAWLNRNINKVVVAPKNWFNDSKKNTIDLIPNTWIRI